MIDTKKDVAEKRKSRAGNGLKFYVVLGHDHCVHTHHHVLFYYYFWGLSFIDISNPFSIKSHSFFFNLYIFFSFYCQRKSMPTNNTKKST